MTFFSTVESFLPSDLPDLDLPDTLPLSEHDSGQAVIFAKEVLVDEPPVLLEEAPVVVSSGIARVDREGILSSKEAQDFLKEALKAGFEELDAAVITNLVMEDEDLHDLVAEIGEDVFLENLQETLGTDAGAALDLLASMNDAEKAETLALIRSMADGDQMTQEDFDQLYELAQDNPQFLESFAVLQEALSASVLESVDPSNKLLFNEAKLYEYKTKLISNGAASIEESVENGEDADTARENYYTSQSSYQEELQSSYGEFLNASADDVLSEHTFGSSPEAVAGESKAKDKPREDKTKKM